MPARSAYAAAFVGERCCGAVCVGACLREDLGGLGLGGAALPCLDAALLGLGACLRDDIGGLVFCLVAPLFGLGGCERDDLGGLALGHCAALGHDRRARASAAATASVRISCVSPSTSARRVCASMSASRSRSVSVWTTGCELARPDQSAEGAGA